VQAARLGLALSLVLALTGTAVALQRSAASSPGVQAATLAAAEPVAAPAPPPPVACHDQPVATQAPGSTAAIPLKAPARAAAPAPPPTVTSVTTTLPAPTPSLVDAGCHPTPDQVAAAQKLVSDTRNAIVARYRRASDAALDDYKPNTIDDSTKTRVWHYTNDQNASDGRILDPTHPEGLLYGRTDRHGLVLIGAFYLMEDPSMHGPEVGGCLTRWHVHQAGAVEMLHVWTVDMPGGPFTNNWDPNYIAGL
jgi:hypothetical protein